MLCEDFCGIFTLHGLKEFERYPSTNSTFLSRTVGGLLYFFSLLFKELIHP